MFYSPDILQRHRGRFATIWLAATQGSKVVKREYLRINVVRTCEEIIQYIVGQAPTPEHGGPRLGFSLYLSAQLQYGLVRVYHKQCDYLIGDIQQILSSLQHTGDLLKIDMVDVEKTAHLLPDCLYLMESFNSALDPFFGVMSIGPELPSPEHIPQVHQLIEVRTPERGLEEISQRRSCRRAVAEGPDTNIASPEMITMKEVELIKAPEFQADKDLPEVTAQELEFLMGQDIPFPETETTRKTGEPRKRHRKQGRVLIGWDWGTWEDLIEVPYKYVKVAPTELLKNPTYTSWMPPVLHELWSCSARQRAVVKQASAAPAAEEEEEVEVGRRREAASEGQVALEPSVSLVASSELSLEVSEEERLRLITPEEKHLFRTSEIKEAALPVLQEVPEPSLAPQETDLLLEEENITAAYVLGAGQVVGSESGASGSIWADHHHGRTSFLSGTVAGRYLSVGWRQDLVSQWGGDRTSFLSRAAAASVPERPFSPVKDVSVLIDPTYLLLKVLFPVLSAVDTVLLFVLLCNGL
nr:PREDICTED: meiotic recombination protein REC8 homolog [Latimeria chalumnae]|eukprot:XP_014342560.1 PREDICTED: meiotic recombination protein REC8 homolog [Latimeria chalumnae]